MAILSPTRTAMMASGVLAGTQYIQLHTGDPGPAGTSNIAGNSTRHSVTMAGSIDGGTTTTRTSNSDGKWSSGEVTTNETYSYVSMWSASSSGTAYMSGAMTPPITVTAGNTFTIPYGSLVLSLT